MRHTSPAPTSRSAEDVSRRARTSGSDGCDSGTLVPGRQRRQFLRVARSLIAAPDHVHVRPQQQKIISVDVARARVREIENLQRRADRCERALQRLTLSRTSLIWPIKFCTEIGLVIYPSKPAAIARS